MQERSAFAAPGVDRSGVLSGGLFVSGQGFIIVAAFVGSVCLAKPVMGTRMWRVSRVWNGRIALTLLTFGAVRDDDTQLCCHVAVVAHAGWLVKIARKL